MQGFPRSSRRGLLAARSSAKKYTGEVGPRLRPRRSGKSSKRSCAFGRPIAWGILAHMESNFAARLFGWRHQLADRLEDGRDFFVVFTNALFQFSKFLRQFAIRFEHPTKLHKRAHDRDIHFHGTFAIQNTRQHRHALFRKRVGSASLLSMPEGTG